MKRHSDNVHIERKGISMKNVEKINQRDLRELQRRERQSAKVPYAAYLIVLCVVVTLIHVVDEVATNLGNMVQSSVVTEFFVTKMGLEYNEGLATMATLSILVGQLSLIAPFYKSLADRFGRKMFLVLNTFGFGLGLFVCYISNSFIVYAVGLAIINFFIAHDMQVVFILETAPKDKRATIYGLTKCLGTVGLVLVPVMRRVFLDADATNWRPLFLIPGLLALIVGTIGFFFIYESKVFVESRIDFLSKPYDERYPVKVKMTREEKKTAKKNQRKAGVFPAIKYLFTHNKDLRWLTITYIVVSSAMVPLSQYYESIMTTGGMTTAQITDAQFVYPFGFAAVVMLSGIIGDKFGRKNTCATAGTISMVAFCLFVVGVLNGWNSYLIGVLYSLFLGCYWTFTDYLALMASEKVPTDVRGSTLGALSLLQFAGIGIGMGSLIGGLAIFPTAFVGTICAAIAVPVLAIGLVILFAKVKETKGADLESIQ